VGTCYKYVCVGNVYYIQKGCLDTLSATQRCDVIDGQCRGQGGNGVCYTCSSNRCNSALTNRLPGNTTLTLLLAMALLSFSLPILSPVIRALRLG